MKKEKEVVLVIGGGPGKDIKKIFDNPAEAEKNEPDFVLYVDSVEQLSSILSAKKMSLLKYLKDASGYNVNEIAIKMGRKQEAISRDLHVLEKCGLVQLRKKGKNVIPEVRAREIVIKF